MRKGTHHHQRSKAALFFVFLEEGNGQEPDGKVHHSEVCATAHLERQHISIFRKATTTKCWFAKRNNLKPQTAHDFITSVTKALKLVMLSPTREFKTQVANVCIGAY